MLPDSVLASVLTVAIQGLNAPYGAPCFLTQMGILRTLAEAS